MVLLADVRHALQSADPGCTIQQASSDVRATQLYLLQLPFKVDPHRRYSSYSSVAQLATIASLLRFAARHILLNIESS